MANQENFNHPAAAGSGFPSNPPLVELASQLSHDNGQLGDQGKPTKPEVVFVDDTKRATQIIEINIPRNQKAQAAGSGEPPEPADPVATPTLSVDTRSDEEPTEITARFAVDPFIYEIDGPVPVMPTLPIVEDDSTTDKVLARERAGDHYAWRLKPGPYPAAGNTCDVPPNPQQPPDSSKVAWEDQEVVSESDDSNGDDGDCFFARPGDVISIDGNQGFDHIDVRSYSIDNATFEPGAILLHGEEGACRDTSDQPTAPITIKHRGVAYAIFKGDIQVEL